MSMMYVPLATPCRSGDGGVGVGVVVVLWWREEDDDAPPEKKRAFGGREEEEEEEVIISCCSTGRALLQAVTVSHAMAS
ncbi:hypothetical protein GUJ93_ZPchr0458g22592 [Zizania palustris]|uniref:Uncharacterized protein n=1 Tax=Zizania palustris TaxID=103762 RepID=A0A8J5RBJ5_ZIZPA|nr:hypothetical protein GUJ93_ZPchr0458g22592 [Zizania palustris]